MDGAVETGLPPYLSSGGGDGASGLVPLTLAEILRLLDLAHPPLPGTSQSPARRFRWSHWRRRHQTIARHGRHRTDLDRVGHEHHPDGVTSR